MGWSVRELTKRSLTAFSMFKRNEIHYLHRLGTVDETSIHRFIGIKKQQKKKIRFNQLERLSEFTSYNLYKYFIEYLPKENWTV